MRNFTELVQEYEAELQRPGGEVTDPTSYRLQGILALAIALCRQERRELRLLEVPAPKYHHMTQCKNALDRAETVLHDLAAQLRQVRQQLKDAGLLT
jgi:hypothetical protein